MPGLDSAPHALTVNLRCAGPKYAISRMAADGENTIMSSTLQPGDRTAGTANRTLVTGSGLRGPQTMTEEIEMKTGRWNGMAALTLAAMAMGMMSPVRADDGGAAKAAGKIAAFWAFPSDAGKVTLVFAGQADPITVDVNDATVFAGICQDCSLPLEFKPAEAGKKCNVCGCAVSNASCIVGKPVKEGTWQAMLKQLPHGVGLRPTFNDPDKPESGVKKLVVDLRSVLLPVVGLDGQMPDQLLALVKPLGGSQAELIDGGKRLSILLKSDWTADREGKLEKALSKLNAKVAVPEESKATR